MLTSHNRVWQFVATATWIGGLIILSANPSLAADKEDRVEQVRKLFQRLDGRWRVTSAEVAGDKIKSDEEWTFTSGNYTWKDSQRTIRGYGSINRSWNPHQIYFHHQHSSKTGPIETGNVRNWDTGIYKLSDDGDTLTVCIGSLPFSEFEATKDNQRRLYVLKRVKEDNPAR
jgi:uncharacterized protein (TIGR03067 family)